MFIGIVKKKSPYPGVSWEAKRNRWRVEIRTRPEKKLYLGYYEDMNEAIRVRKAAEKLYYGV